MNYSFFFNKIIPTDPILLKLSSLLSSLINKSSCSTTHEYNVFMKDIIHTAKKYPLTTLSPLYKKEIIPINNNDPLTEKTLWGGVSLKKVDVNNNFIRKFLVIRQYGILGFEIHHRKRERLKILEGVCLVFYSNRKSQDWKKGITKVKIAKKGDIFTFIPGDEHGIITLSDCVIEETSTNHLNDLKYIFRAFQITEPVKN